MPLKSIICSSLTFKSIVGYRRKGEIEKFFKELTTELQHRQNHETMTRQNTGLRKKATHEKINHLNQSSTNTALQVKQSIRKKVHLDQQITSGRPDLLLRKLLSHYKESSFCLTLPLALYYYRSYYW